jgi:hypothetical protein
VARDPRHGHSIHLSGAACSSLTKAGISFFATAWQETLAMAIQFIFRAPHARA